MRLIDADKVFPWYVKAFSAEEIGKEKEIKPDEVRFSMNDIRENLSNIPKEQEPKTEPIPKGATNGDVFKIMFNKTFPKTIAMYENDESRLTINLIFSREWWETPYKVESEDT